MAWTFGVVAATLLIASVVPTGTDMPAPAMRPWTSVASADAQNGTGPSGPSGPRQELVLFLRAQGTPPACTDLTLNATDASGDADRCGSAEPSPPSPVGQPFTYAYEGQQRLNGTIRGPSGSDRFVARYFIYVATDGPDEVGLQVDVVVGGARCIGFPPEQHRVLPQWAAFEGDCIFSGKAQPDDKPRLDLSVRRLASAYIGHEGDHASRVEIQYEPVAEEPDRRRGRTGPNDPPAPGEEPGAAPGAPKKASGAAFLLVPGAWLILALLRRRR